MRKFKQVLSVVMCISILMGFVTGCGSGKTTKPTDSEVKQEEAKESQNDNLEQEEDQDPFADMDNVKIGVLIYDSTDSEVVAFQNYYKDYIEKHFPVEFIYSESINTAEQEISAIENFINLKAKGIISLSDQDRVASIKLCEEAQVYYGVAAGTLSDEQYEELKGYDYYVGSIGPSLLNEEEVGYNMAKHYIDEGNENFLIYAGGYPYVDMHLFRTNGMIRAFEEVGVTYTPGDRGGFGTFESDTYEIDTIDGFPDEAGAFFGTAAHKLATEELEVVLTSALGVELFGTSIAQTNPELKLATVAAYTAAYDEAFNAEAPQCDYLAGKFSASIGPIFVAIFNAIHGDIDVVRDGEEAFRIDQGYWVSIGKEEFNHRFAMSNSTENPAYTAEDLSELVLKSNPDTNFEEFKSFVESYKFEEISLLHQ